MVRSEFEGIGWRVVELGCQELGSLCRKDLAGLVRSYIRRADPTRLGSLFWYPAGRRSRNKGVMGGELGCVGGVPHTPLLQDQLRGEKHKRTHGEDQ